MWDWDWDWLGPTLGAVGGFLVAVGGVWLKLRADRREDREQRTKLAAGEDKRRQDAERRARRDAIDEYQQALADLRKDRDSDRELIHGLRDDLHKLQLQRELDKRTFEVELQNHKERLVECELDRIDLRKKISELERIKGNGGIGR